MSQSLWESDTEAEKQAEGKQADLAELNEQPNLEEHSNVDHSEPVPFFEQPAEPVQMAEPVKDPVSTESATALPSEILAVSVVDFEALEERVLRTVNLVKKERLTRAEAEARAVKAEAELSAQVPLVDRLHSEIKELRSERDQVRQRVERLLSQLDALEL